TSTGPFLKPATMTGLAAAAAGEAALASAGAPAMTAAVTAATAPATAAVFTFRAMIPSISPAPSGPAFWPGIPGGGPFHRRVAEHKTGLSGRFRTIYETSARPFSDPCSQLGDSTAQNRASEAGSTASNARWTRRVGMRPNLPERPQPRQARPAPVRYQPGG